MTMIMCGLLLACPLNGPFESHSPYSQKTDPCSAGID